MTGLENVILDWIQKTYEVIGWPGVILFMAIESASIPLPSEIVMPLAGWFLVKNGGHSVWFVFLAALLGSLGNLVGSLVGYWIGAKGGRLLVNRFGKFFLISSGDLDRGEKWFQRYGDIAIFASRLLPIVRTFVSMPAGAARMNILRFSILTFLGSYPFVLGLTFGGYLLGANWERLRGPFRNFDIPFALILLIVIAFFFWRHYKKVWHPKSVQESEGIKRNS